MEKLMVVTISKDLIRILEEGKVPTMNQCGRFIYRLQEIKPISEEIKDHKKAIINILMACLKSEDCVF